MITIPYSQEFDADACADAIINDEFKGFREDYLVLHAIVRREKPKTIFEIGTNRGTGTKILKNAAGPACVVFTLDLPPETMHPSLWSGKRDLVGINCNLPYVQLRGDSMTFDYYKYPCELYFVDGEHDTEHVEHETREILKQKPSTVVYHDADIPEVMEGIKRGSKDTPYLLFRVADTRIAYLTKLIQ